jgi:hypothetical protein
MTKQLPFYQFEPAEHLAGDIQMCSLAAQGLFENIKCVYWIKGCELTLKQLKGRFNEPDLLNELIDNEILKIEGEEICIEFLDNQFNEITERKKLLSKAGKKGWLLKKKKQATLKPPLSEVQAPLKQPYNIIEYKKSVYTSDFESFWNKYPKKTGKGGAFSSWKKLTKSEKDKISDALDWQIPSEQWTKDSGQYIPNPQTYLNQKRWDDAPTEVKKMKNQVYN